MAHIFKFPQIVRSVSPNTLLWGGGKTMCVALILSDIVFKSKKKGVRAAPLSWFHILKGRSRTALEWQGVPCQQPQFRVCVFKLCFVNHPLLVLFVVFFYFSKQNNWHLRAMNTHLELQQMPQKCLFSAWEG